MGEYARVRAVCDSIVYGALSMWSGVCPVSIIDPASQFMGLTLARVKMRSTSVLVTRLSTMPASCTHTEGRWFSVYHLLVSHFIR